jgi:FlaA1/EpsC-like NDP-sugar epimerase
VFHVAAYKHVPLLEKQIRIAMFNNIIGTKIVAELAEKNSVESFVLISTDKAVNPTSVMGATKRASEMFCQTYNLNSSTRFITVRFGNVLDSAGSVIPLFRSQLQNGGPLTVTHREISRYFMTIPEASQLILQASTMYHQGDIFVLDMGEPINIKYLAEQMIKLAGKTLSQDIDIVYTGLRPGEKLHEELFHQDENLCKTSHGKIKQAKVRAYELKQMQPILEEIEIAYHKHDENKLMILLCNLVPEFQNDSALEQLSVKERRSNYALSFNET